MPTLVLPLALPFRCWVGKDRMRASDCGDPSSSALAASEFIAANELMKRGLDYLYSVRSLALEPDLISIIYDLERRTPVCTWIGAEIDSLNAHLTQILQNCQDCFHPWQQRPIQILAAPFSPTFALDGVCSLHAEPTTILVDVGRVCPADWMALVMHEFAHAHLNAPGHNAPFQQILKHLSLALGVDQPFPPADDPERWRSFPSYRVTGNSLAFWRGGDG